MAVARATVQQHPSLRSLIEPEAKALHVSTTRECMPCQRCRLRMDKFSPYYNKKIMTLSPIASHYREPRCLEMRGAMKGVAAVSRTLGGSGMGGGLSGARKGLGRQEEAGCLVGPPRTDMALTTGRRRRRRVQTGGSRKKTDNITWIDGHVTFIHGREEEGVLVKAMADVSAEEEVTAKEDAPSLSAGHGEGDTKGLGQQDHGLDNGGPLHQSVGVQKSRAESDSDGVAMIDRLVVLTRERGKNNKLMESLAVKGVECVELPLIEYVDGPQATELVPALQDVEWEWVILTSPEAASVFLKSWRKSGSPVLRIAVVGAGTGKVIEDDVQTIGGDGHLPLTIGFQPSKAQGVYLAAELPFPDAADVSTPRVLYPASLKASHDIEEGLTKRGFAVTRLNTYSTETVKHPDWDSLSKAISAPVVTFASPTAVRAWMHHVSANKFEWHGTAACIGSTTAVAATKAGIASVLYPSNPGIDGWTEIIMQALTEKIEQQQ